MSSEKTPPCSEWGIWRGKEIEGSINRGAETLFVRSGDPEKYWKDYNRIWFTREFRDWEKIKIAIRLGFEVAIESDVNEMQSQVFPEFVLNNARIYVKVRLPGIKEGDHICVGCHFDDEALCVGDGVRVSPDQYYDDVRIE